MTATITRRDLMGLRGRMVKERVNSRAEKCGDNKENESGEFTRN